MSGGVIIRYLPKGNRPAQGSRASENDDTRSQTLCIIQVSWWTLAASDANWLC